MDAISSVWPPSPIRTTRLVLRRSEARDREVYIELASAPEVWTFLGGARDQSELATIVPAIPGDLPGVFIVELDGKMIGTVVLDRRDPNRPGHIMESGYELEISYTFSPTCWGRGYASEAVEAAVDWAGRALTDADLLLCTQSANTASMRLAQHMGFVEVGRFEEFGAEQWLGRRALRS